MAVHRASVPTALLSLVFGRIADRYDRRTLCLIADVASALAALYRCGNAALPDSGRTRPAPPEPPDRAGAQTEDAELGPGTRRHRTDLLEQTDVAGDPALSQAACTSATANGPS